MPFAAVCNVCGTKWVLEFNGLRGTHDIILHQPMEFDQLLFADGNVVFCNKKCRKSYLYNVRLITRGEIKVGVRKKGGSTTEIVE